VSRRGPWLPVRAAKRAGVLTLVLAGVVLPSSYAAFSSTDFASGSLTSASSFYGSAVQSDGPAGYWRLDGPSVADSAGSHAGTTVGTVGYVPGATPDGDNAVQTTTAGNLLLPWTVTGDASVELSFKVAAGTSTSGSSGYWPSVSPIVSTWTQSAAGDFGIGLDSGGDLVAGMGTGGSDATIASTGTSYKDGSWHHVVWTRTLSTGAMRVYADGALVASGPGGTGPLNARTTLSLGVVPWFNAPSGSIPPALDVSIDDVATYPSVLTAARVGVHNAARTAGYSAVVTADAPAGYWRLDDAAGPAAAATVGADGGYVGTVTYAVPGAVVGDTAVDLLSTVGYVAVQRLVSNDFSIELWFKDRTPAEDGHTQWWQGAALVDGDVGTVNNDFGISLDGSGHVMAGVGNPDTTIHANAANYADGAWHYVVFTRAMASGAITLYVDGALQASNPGTGNTQPLNAASVLTLGEYAMGTGGGGAAIDELAQYPTVLTAAQVSAHYAQAQ
jgi:hypothetical protein